MSEVCERGFGSVKSLVPSHKGSFGDLIASADEGNRSATTIGFDSMVASIKGVWQITKGLWYTSHEKIPF